MNLSKDCTAGLCKAGPEELDRILEKSEIRASDEDDEEADIIRMGGTVIGTAGNFSLTVGKPKSKKTFNVTALAAAALSGERVLDYTVTLPKDRRRVLYFDTEQGRCHCRKVARRINVMAGMGERDVCGRIEFHSLKRWDPEYRCAVICRALERSGDFGLVIIDGARDLLRDINNPTEATSVVGMLMAVSDLYNIHVHTVIHLNKSDENTRGHIGSELVNKAETVLRVVRDPERVSVSEVQPVVTRDLPPRPFAFELDSRALPRLLENYRPSPEDDDKKPSLSKLPEEIHFRVLEAVFGERNAMRHTPLVDAMTEAYGAEGYERSRASFSNHIKFLKKKGILFQNGKDYVYNRDLSSHPR